MSGREPVVLDEMRRELRSLRRQVRLQQFGGAVLTGCLLLMVTIGAAPNGTGDGHFGRLFARQLIVRDDRGQTVAQVYGVDGGGALLLRGAGGARDGIHLIAGAERNDVMVYDMKGNLAAAVQGIGREGRLSTYQTFADRATADAAMAPRRPDSHISAANGNEITVATVRLPEEAR